MKATCEGCYDGVATVIDGECLYGCAAGSSLDRNGVPVQHPEARMQGLLGGFTKAFPHDTRVNGTCSRSELRRKDSVDSVDSGQDGVGLVELYCNNTVVTAVGSQDCRRHCPPQTTMCLAPCSRKVSETGLGMAPTSPRPTSNTCRAPPCHLQL